MPRETPRSTNGYAQLFYASSWYILSAKYGFLFPDDIVPGPYNVTFNDPKSGPITAEQLGAQAKEKGLTSCERVVVLGGRNYVRLVRQALDGIPIYLPLNGCKGNGFMMQKLKQAVEAGTPLC
jgi:hypothetical protein